jgi:hypothetical protein
MPGLLARLSDADAWPIHDPLELRFGHALHNRIPFEPDVSLRDPRVGARKFAIVGGFTHPQRTNRVEYNGMADAMAASNLEHGASSP